MSTITTRSGKGSPLTTSEVDANFTNLNTDKLEDITSESIKDLSDVNSSMTPTDGQALLYDTTNGWQAESIITDVVGDTTPQLGGALDVNGNSIVSVSNGDINLTPDGTGTVNLNKTVDVTYGNVSFPGTQLDYEATASGLFDSMVESGFAVYTNNRGYLVGGGGGNTGYVVQEPKYISNLSVNSSGISFRIHGTAVQQGSNMTWTTSSLIGYADVIFYWSNGTYASYVTNGPNTGNVASNISGTVYNISLSSDAAALDAAIVSAAEAAGVSSNLYDWIPDEVTVTESSDVFRARLAGSTTDLDTHSFTQVSPQTANEYVYNHRVLAGRFLILSYYPNHNASDFNNTNASANPSSGMMVGRFTRTVQTQATPFGIVTTTNGNINLDPNGSGKVIFKGNSTKGSGQFVLNCEQNSHGITIKGPAHSAAANYTLIMPDDDGSSGQALTTDGSGNLSWTTPAGSYTHPNHSGEVTSTGDGATVIADDVVDEANLKVSNTPTDGYVLTARSGNTGGMTWEAASGGIALTDLSVTQNTASGSGTLSYDNTSGVFSYTPPVISGGGGGSTASALTEQEFTATAGQTVFTVTGGITNADNVVVFLNGSRLFSTDVTVSDTANTVTLAAGATVGDLVTVSEFGAAFGSQYSSSIFTVGTSSEYNTSTKVLTTSYTANRVAVYLNGVKLLVGTDCTATNGTTIDLTNAAPVTGDKIEVVEHGTLADTVTTLTGLSDTPSSLGTAGQILQVNSGATALEFADASGGSGVTTYANKTAIDAVSSPSEGDLAYDLAADQLYLRTTSSWERIYVGAQEDVVWTTELNSAYNFAVGGSATTLTVAASDPEGFPITYAYTTVPSSTNLATISQGTGANSNQFSVTPNNSSTTGTFTLRVTADDGVSKIKTVSSITVAPVTSKLDLSTGTGGGNGTAVYTASGGAVITAPNNTYSSYYDMEHLFDGDTSSGLNYYWMTNGGTADYLEVDLSSHTVNSTAISYIGKILVYPLCRSDTFTGVTSVDVSSDGSTWTNVAGDQDMNSGDFAFGDYKEIAINSYATYIRIGMSRSGNWGFSMHELEIYAS